MGQTVIALICIALFCEFGVISVLSASTTGGAKIPESEYGNKAKEELTKVINDIPDEDLKNELIKVDIPNKAKMAYDTVFSDGWKNLKEFSSGDIVDSKEVTVNNQTYKVYRGKAELDLAPEKLLELLHDKFEDQPTWNHSYKECKILQSINGIKTDITYRQVDLPAVTEDRDYVAFRHKFNFGNVLTVFTMSFEYSKAPQVPKSFTRAYIGPSCSIINAVEGDASKSTLRSLVDSDLKGNIGRKSFDWVVAKLQKIYMSNLRDHIKKLPK